MSLPVNPASCQSSHLRRIAGRLAIVPGRPGAGHRRRAGASGSRVGREAGERLGPGQLGGDRGDERQERRGDVVGVDLVPGEVQLVRPRGRRLWTSSARPGSTSTASLPGAPAAGVGDAQTGSRRGWRRSARTSRAGRGTTAACPSRTRGRGAAARPWRRLVIRAAGSSSSSSFSPRRSDVAPPASANFRS